MMQDFAKVYQDLVNSMTYVRLSSKMVQYITFLQAPKVFLNYMILFAVMW